MAPTITIGNTIVSLLCISTVLLAAYRPLRAQKGTWSFTFLVLIGGRAVFFPIRYQTIIDIRINLRKQLRIMPNRTFYEQLPIASSFTGARAQRLASLISEQGDAFLEAAGLVTPARCVSTILYLDHNGPASLVEIARALDEQHQLTAHRAKQLENLSIVTREADPNDQRRRTFHLTRKGKGEAKRVEARCRQAIDVFEDVSQEIGFDLNRVLDLAYEALKRRSMTGRTVGNSAKKSNVTLTQKMG